VYRDVPRAVKNWLPFVLMAALVAFYLPVLTGTRFFWEDIADAYPVSSYVANSLRHLQLPYWLPYLSCGSPLIAELCGVFYPPNWLLILFVGPDGRLSFRAIELEVILHLLLAGLLMYRLMREWKVSKQASVYAGLAFMFSGFMSVRTIHPSIVFPLAWFPLVLLLVVRALDGRRFAPALAAGLVMGLAVLVGHPQIIMHMAYALGLYVLVHAVRNWRAEGPRVLLRGAAVLGLVGLVGFGIAAAQYLPTLEFIKHSTRASISYELMTDCSLPPANLLTLFVPKALGSVSGPIGHSVSVSSPLTVYNYSYCETMIYLGILPLFLAGFALADKKQPLRWFCIVLAALALALAFGSYTPLYRVALTVLPGFSMFRIPARLGDLFTFAMCVMAGFGMELFLREGTERLAKNLLKVIAACAGWAVLVWISLSSGLLRSQQGFPGTLGRQWTLFTALVLSAAAVVFWRTRKNWTRTGGYWLIVGVTFLDLFTFGHDFNASRHSPTQFPLALSSAISRVQQELKQEVFRVSMSGGSRFRLGRNRGTWDGVEMPDGYTGWTVARFAQVGLSQHILDLFNVKYEIDPTGQRLIPNPGYLPRARMVYQFQIAATDSAALKTVRDGGFDYRNVVILEHAPGFPSRTGDSVRNEVVITRREAERMELQVRTEDRGILVMSEVYYPEWKALVDGRPAEIYPVDYVLRGMTLSAGSHRVEMYFDTSRVRRGMLISLLTLVITVGFVLTLRRENSVGSSADTSDCRAR
jgi:hypothetical protein